MNPPVSRIHLPRDFQGVCLLLLVVVFSRNLLFFGIICLILCLLMLNKRVCLYIYKFCIKEHPIFESSHFSIHNIHHHQNCGYDIHSEEFKQLKSFLGENDTSTKKLHGKTNSRQTTISQYSTVKLRTANFGSTTQRTTYKYLKYIYFEN